METILEFEKPVAELEIKIRELRRLSDDDDVNIVDEVLRLELKRDQLLQDTYTKLSPWQKTLVARHQARPRFKDYVSRLIDNFMPLAGDRGFSDDSAIVGGMGRFEGRAVLVIGHEKGWDTESRVKHNFGMARPEGYRKAVRLMKLADRFGLPVITLVDTPGAYPGVGAEERGQAEAIARSTEMCLKLRVPMVSTILGEGGSGGAVALATGNSVLMLEHAIYSVISPEGCASILWRSAENAEDAANALKLTAADLLRLNVVDEVVSEPLGGAHRQAETMIEEVGKAISRNLNRLSRMSPDELLEHRRQKYLAMGTVSVA